MVATACSVQRSGLAPAERRDGGQEDAAADATDEGSPPDVCRDRDRDGYCAGADCDDTRADVHPDAVESCSEPGDEDCDGAIDEGCAWNFGRPSPLVRLHVSTDAHLSPALSADGLRLYFVVKATDGTSHLWAASRLTLEAHFNSIVPVQGEDFGSYDIGAIALSPDERELFASATPHGSGRPTAIYRATRAQPTSRFGALALVSGITSSAGSDTAPYLSHDGSELLFTSTRVGAPRIFRALRPTPTASFGAATVLDLPSDGIDMGDGTPSLTVDDRTLFFSRVVAPGDSNLMIATRAGPHDTTFGMPIEATALDAPGSENEFPFVSQSTQEVFFSSSRPWSPAAMGIWRARLCRDAPCDEPLIECDAGVRSPDGRHCYTLETAPLGWDAAEGMCASMHGTLATIHSQAEHDLIWSMDPTQIALGATDRTSECNVTIPGCVFQWVTAEPFLWSDWGPGQPDNAGGVEDCAELYAGFGGALNDYPCNVPLPFVCERELWPW